MNGIGERDSFGSSFSELWEALLYGSGGYRFLRWMLALTLLAGTIWSGFLFHQMLEMMHPREARIPPAASKVSGEAERLAGEVEEFRRAVLAREGSNQLAVMASRIERQPFAPGALPVEEIEEPEVPEPGTVKAKAEEGLFAASEEVLPPFMAVQAVMVMGSRRMAVMDIEGESPGKIVRAGTSFGEGKGKILRVGPDVVVVSWADKRIEIPVTM